MALRDNTEISMFLSGKDVINRPEFNDPMIAVGKLYFTEITNAIQEIIEISVNIDLPQSLIISTTAFVSKWIAINNKLETFNKRIGVDQQLNTYNNEIIELFNEYSLGHKYINQVGTGARITEPNNFLTTYAMVRSLQNVNLSKEVNKVTELDKLISTAKTMNASMTTMVNEVQRVVSDKTFAEYARIFTKEAEAHSRLDVDFDFKKKWYKLFSVNIGSAQIWLGFGIILMLSFAYLIVSGELNNVLPIEGEGGELYAKIFTRFLAIGTGIYLITFAFKQYSINKHLAVLNRHRANALNSYKLFTGLIDQADTNSRNALMLQVSKAIYEQSNTGHLSSKNQDSTSIIEMTKYINQPHQ